MRILLLESSTTSAKAMVYDSHTGIQKILTKTYDHVYDDITQHDAESVFRQTAELGRLVAEGEKMHYVALSGTWHSCMLVHPDGTPATPLYPWSYTGASGICGELRRNYTYVQSHYQKTGCMVNAIYPLYKLKLLAEQGKQLSDYWIMGQGSYEFYRLTGVRAVTDCMASGSGLMNLVTGRWDPEILSELSISEDNLGKITSYQETSPLSAEGAAILGIPAGTPVINSCADGGMNQVGAGAVREGIMTFSAGTSAAIRMSVGKPLLPKQPATWCYRSPVSYLAGAATSGCCNCVDWAREKLFPAGTSYKEIEKGFSENRPTPVFLPFLFGERCPGWQDERLGGFEAVSGANTASDLYKAVLEGTMFNIYQCYQTLTGLCGEPEHIKFSGGILHSAYWSQMCADLFGRELEVTDTEHSSLVGGAVLAMTAAGELASAADFETPTVRVIRPDPGKRAEYDDKYERWLSWYHAQEHLAK